ncbi:hypothetical protein APS_0356 [Acetobacter pasteurianus subsp. pasteurianus LMG 1262 = NBRC 106471]|nr:hypothetical protein APS_0356 [Acetobacter pasteurianus subsp. pasteurianus LMG 1262 = NBRC 106471]
MDIYAEYRCYGLIKDVSLVKGHDRMVKNGLALLGVGSFCSNIWEQ